MGTYVEMEDETGATALRASLIAGTAFFWPVGVDLSRWQDGLHRLTLHDSGAKAAVGWLQAAVPVGESLGTEKALNGGFAAWTGDNPDSWGVSNENANNYVTQNPAGVANVISNNTAAITLYQIIANSTGYLFKLTFNITVATLGWRFSTSDGEIAIANYTTQGAFAWYATAKDASFSINWFRHNGGASNFTLDDVSLKQVTDPPSTGARIVSASGGATRDFASIDAGFDANAITTFEVERYIDSARYTRARGLHLTSEGVR